MTSASDARGYPLFLVSASPPARNQVWLATVVVLGLIIMLMLTAPLARVTPANTEMLLPAYAAATFFNELTTSVLLLALFSVQRSRAVLFLAAGYLFSGLMVVPWALTFPGGVHRVRGR